MSGAVTKEISRAEIDDITEDIATIYGVDAKDVSTSIDYVASGVLNVTIPKEMSREDAVNALQESISEALGVHPKDVLVSIDDDGLVTYQVSAPTFEGAEALLQKIEEEGFASSVTDELKRGESGIIVHTVESDGDVDAVISGTCLCNFICFLY